MKTKIILIFSLLCLSQAIFAEQSYLKNMYEACLRGDYESLEELSLKNNINSRDSNFPDGLLHRLTDDLLTDVGNQLEYYEEILKAGVRLGLNLNLITQEGLSVLEKSVWALSFDTAKVLFELGVQVEVDLLRDIDNKLESLEVTDFEFFVLEKIFVLLRER